MVDGPTLLYSYNFLTRLQRQLDVEYFNIRLKFRDIDNGTTYFRKYSSLSSLLQTWPCLQNPSSSNCDVKCWIGSFVKIQNLNLKNNGFDFFNSYVIYNVFNEPFFIPFFDFDNIRGNKNSFNKDRFQSRLRSMLKNYSENISQIEQQQEDLYIEQCYYTKGYINKSN